MCDAEYDLEKVERENEKLHTVIAELKGAKTDNDETLIPVEEINKLKHRNDCFTLYAGCVCIKRFADWVVTPNANKDEY